MNREIKFRAWHKPSKTMLSWDGMYGIVREDDDKIAVHVAISDYCYYMSAEIELMQFTGMFDRNRKEIYEGDIVRFKSNPNPTYRGQVKWSIEFARFMIEYFASELERQRNYPSLHFFSHENLLEVIGNIFENPELLKTDA